ncbi:hypothetical protein KKE33_04515, partial [Patescibacteria group bacterium]|nr:hypothetical protein [Patescibacteria group bacterium]
NKSKHSNELLLVQPEGYQELLETAIFSKGWPKESYIKPRWSQVWAILTSQPCELVGCDFGDKHSDSVGGVAWKFPAMISVLLGITSFVSIVFAARNVQILDGIVSLISLVFFTKIFLYCHIQTCWNIHQEAIKEKLQERLEVNPAETIVSYLSGRLSDAKMRILCSESPLRKIQERLRERIEAVCTTVNQLEHRSKNRTGATKQALVDAEERMKNLYIRLKAGQEQIDSHIASVEAFFAEYAVQIEVLKAPVDDLPLLRQAAEHEAEAEEELTQFEGVIMNSVIQMQKQIGDWQDRIATTMTEPSKVLFVSSDGADLEADLERYEQAAAAAFPSRLSPADVSDS